MQNLLWEFLFKIPGLFARPSAAFGFVYLAKVFSFFPHTTRETYDSVALARSWESLIGLKSACLPCLVVPPAVLRPCYRKPVSGLAADQLGLKLLRTCFPQNTNTTLLIRYNRTNTTAKGTRAALVACQQEAACQTHFSFRKGYIEKWNTSCKSISQWSRALRFLAQQRRASSLSCLSSSKQEHVSWRSLSKQFAENIFGFRDICR